MNKAILGLTINPDKKVSAKRIIEYVNRRIKDKWRRNGEEMAN